MVKWILKIGGALVALAASILIGKGADKLGEEYAEKHSADTDELDKLADDAATTETDQADTKPADDVQEEVQ